MALPNEFIEEVRNRNDIVAVLSDYVNLKRTGNNYKCLCPFHHEDTPSLVVSPAKQIYHCFGCQQGGNVFSFVMKMDNSTFLEAIEKLAQRVGMTLPETVPQKELQQKNKEKEQFASANELACTMYSRVLENLPEAAAARGYLSKRGLTPEIIRAFRLGYAPAAGDYFLKAALQKGFKTDLLQKAGLTGTHNNRVFDYFRKRIVYPIIDGKGKVAGFGARTLDDAVQPKYLNTQETILFSKGKLLYGLSFASSAIRQKEEVVMVEGYMDVVACHQFGITNCVATMGVALTEEHIEIIKRYCSKIILMFDMDQAGINAAWRSLDLLFGKGFEVKVITGLGTKDPDEFLHQFGGEALGKKLQEAVPALTFMLDRLIEQTDSSTVQGKVKIVSNLLPFIARIPNVIEQKEEVKKIALTLRLGEEVLLQQLSQINKKSFQKNLTEKIMTVSSDTGYEKAQKELLSIFLTHPDLFEQWGSELADDDITDERVKKIFAVLHTVFKRSNNYSVSEIIDYLQDEKLSILVTQLVLEQGKYGKIEDGVKELLIAVKKERKRTRYLFLSSEISRLLEKNEPVDGAVFQEYQELTKLFKGSK